LIYEELPGNIIKHAAIFQSLAKSRDASQASPQKSNNPLIP